MSTPGWNDKWHNGWGTYPCRVVYLRCTYTHFDAVAAVRPFTTLGVGVKITIFVIAYGEGKYPIQ